LQGNENYSYTIKNLIFSAVHLIYTKLLSLSYIITQLDTNY